MQKKSEQKESGICAAGDWAYAGTPAASKGHRPVRYGKGHGAILVLFPYVLEYTFNT